VGWVGKLVALGSVFHRRVLFTLLAYRYERIVFKDPMTTAAAIDRLVHHSVVLELNVPSYRAEQTRKRKYTDK